MGVWLAMTRHGSEVSMNAAPENFNPILVRTDFSDDIAWQKIRAAILEVPADLREGIEAMKAVNADAGIDVSGYDQPMEFVRIVDEIRNADLSAEDVLKLAAPHDVCIFVVDDRTISNADHPILVVDVGVQRGRTFRSIPSEVWSIASNLPIANMDWEDFSDHVDKDGVFRGYSDSEP
jgi:hypothetical protein